MRYYVVKSGGRGSKSRIPGYTAVGKTGTARKIINGKYSNKYHVASFLGFAPVENPQFVLLVVIDEPRVKYIPGQGHNNHGSIAAAPVFSAVATKIFQLTSFPPDDPYGWPQGDPRRDSEKIVWKKEMNLLKEKFERYNN